jgi:O-antigen/teichoic acid export membrane protein
MWRKQASRIRVSLYQLDGSVLKKMMAYCSVLAIWSAGMLCVNGLDVTIVGRYDFGQTGFYSIATLPINFMISIMGAALGPFLPTTSALSTQRTPTEMGNLLSRATRFTTIALILSGLPLLVIGIPILRLWVGPEYALQSIGYLRILVLANIVRMLCAPYATMLVATESQKVAIAGATAEAVVNLGSSIYFARHIGAIGVAYGTLLGALVSVAMHFALSMHYTQAKFAVSRIRLFLKGMLGPTAIAGPSLILLPYWWSTRTPSLNLPLWLGWAISTLLLAWFTGLNAQERSRLVGLARSRMKLVASYN